MSEGSGPAESYLDLFGLTREPFSGEMTPALFYPGASREQRLNLMLHLLPLGETLLITGGRGIGKRTLLDQFVAKSRASWHLCRLDASSGLDSNQLLQQLAQTFSPEALVLAKLALTEQAETEWAEVERLLIAQWQGLRKNAQTPILLIDNAHHISESGLRTLSKFIAEDADEEKLLGIALFSELAIEEKLNNPLLQTLRSQIKHTFELPLLSEQETSHYLNHRMRAAGFQGDSPFTAAASKAIFGASNGLPLKLNELAQAVLQNKRHVAARVLPAKPAEMGDAKEKRFSVVRLWPFVVAVLLASVLLFQDEINALFEASADKPQQTIKLPLPEITTAQSRSRPQLGSQGDIQRDVTSIEIDEAVLSDDEAVIDEAVNEIVDESMGPQSLARVAQQAGEQAAVPGQMEPLEQAGAVVVETQVVLLPATELAAERPGDATMIAPPLGDEASLLSQSDEEDNSWVLAQRPQAYTLQIVAQEQLQKREEFIARFGLESGVERFSIDKKGRRWYVAAIGVYASHSEALDASGQLPQGVVPWARSFASIQQALWQRAVDAVAEKDAVIVSSLSASQTETTEQERWALARAPDHFVLQLVAFEQASKTRDFIKQHALGDEAKQVRLINNERIWYVAVFGDISDREGALELAGGLVKDKKISRPWVRSFASLQQAMREFQQQ